MTAVTPTPSRGHADGQAALCTIGVAIGIPDPYAGELRRWRKRVGDPLAEFVPPHVTLLPPTEVAVDDLDEIERHLAAAAAGNPAFEMRLSGTGTFAPMSPVVFVQVSVGIAQCELLERDVRSGPLHREPLFPYHPHVTVAHGVPPAQLDVAYDGLDHYRARFPVDVFTIFEQDPGGVWRRRRDFALAAGPVVAPG